MEILNYDQTLELVEPFMEKSGIFVKENRMKLTTKSLKFWEDMGSTIQGRINEIIKLYLKEKGRSEHGYIFYRVEMDLNGFPIRVTANTACHCHPEYRTIFTLSAKEIAYPSLFIDRIKMEEKES